MNYTEFIESIKNHLNKPKGLIGVTQGSNKLQKNNTNILKYNWSLEDVTAEFGSVEALLKSLPKKGFSNGAILFFRFKHGTSTRIEAETVLEFPNSDQKLAQPQTQPKTDPNMQSNSQPDNQTSIESNKAPLAMGYSQIPHHELIDLKIQQQRYVEIVDQKSRAEKERDKAESDLRIAKEDLAKAKRDLDLIEDKHELKLERLKSENRKFFETAEGKALLETAPAICSQFLDVLKAKNTPQPLGMGSPLAGLNQQQNEFIQEFAKAPEQMAPLLHNIMYHVVSDDTFYEKLNAFIEQNTTKTDIS